MWPRALLVPVLEGRVAGEPHSATRETALPGRLFAESTIRRLPAAMLRNSIRAARIRRHQDPRGGFRGACARPGIGRVAAASKSRSDPGLVSDKNMQQAWPELDHDPDRRYGHEHSRTEFLKITVRRAPEDVIQERNGQPRCRYQNTNRPLTESANRAREHKRCAYRKSQPGRLGLSATKQCCAQHTDCYCYNLRKIT
jgi:hypothetical protein